MESDRKLRPTEKPHVVVSAQSPNPRQESHDLLMNDYIPRDLDISISPLLNQGLIKISLSSSAKPSNDLDRIELYARTAGYNVIHKFIPPPEENS